MLNNIWQNLSYENGRKLQAHSVPTGKDIGLVKNIYTSDNLQSNVIFFTLSLVLVLFISMNLKNFPGVWHVSFLLAHFTDIFLTDIRQMRLLNAFRFILKSSQPTLPLSHDNIFQSVVTTSHTPWLEADFNLHKNNATYFSDVDISRTHLVCTLLAKGIAKNRGGTAAYTGTSSTTFGLALGAVSCSFCKEIPPYKTYEMCSRILSWDNKWLYIVTHFTSHTKRQTPGASEKQTSKVGDAGHRSTTTKDNQTEIFATALSKCVFKANHKTVSPDAILRDSELLPLHPNKGAEAALHEIEIQRQAGLSLVESLTLDSQKCFQKDLYHDALDYGIMARHTDGSGVMGVVMTLFQLAGFRSRPYI